MQITHEAFKHIAKYSPQLLLDVFNIGDNSFKSLTNNINKFTERYNKTEHIFNIYESYISEYHDRNSEIDDKDRLNKLKGDLFEIFGEIFFKSLSLSKHSGIINFEHINDNDDVGVDATGYIDGEKVAIQFKYRSNPTDELNSSDLNNFMGAAYRKCNINVFPVSENIKRNLILFTNCKGLHFNSIKNTDNAIWVFSTKSEDSNLNKILDGNITFWQNCLSVIQSNIENI